MSGVAATGRSAEACPTPASEETATVNCGEPSLTALEAGPDGATAAAVDVRIERALDDALLSGTAATKIAALGDPLAMQFLAQSWIRELRIEVRTGAAEDAAGRAETAAEERDALLREAERMAAEAASAGELGRIFSIIGAAISVAAGAIGAVFSGGATLVGAVGLAIAVLGPLVTSELAAAGVIQDPNVATGIGLGCAVVGTILSFGAGSGSAASTGATTAAKTAAATAATAADVAAKTAAAAARAAVEATITTLKVGAAAAEVAVAGSDVAAAVYTREGAHREADADGREATREASREEVSSAHDEIGALMREATRAAARMRAVMEARSAALRAAASFRA